MTDTVAILIGITGKIALPDGAAETVRARLRKVFAELDTLYPGTSKLLLTGGARGTDLIAAQEALQPERDLWRVAVLLPFAQSLFEKDFQDDTARHAFNALIAEAGCDTPRVIIRTLPPLRTDSGAPATPAQLDRGNHANDPMRRQHYEQVGQFIAETAMVLIAVMDPDEQPDLKQANGGTARIVAYRRAGRPDSIGAEMAERSAVVRRHWSPLVAPPAGAVWLIDPHTPPRDRPGAASRPGRDRHVHRPSRA